MSERGSKLIAFDWLMVFVLQFVFNDSSWEWSRPAIDLSLTVTLLACDHNHLWTLTQFWKKWKVCRNLCRETLREFRKQMLSASGCRGKFSWRQLDPHLLYSLHHFLLAMNHHRIWIEFHHWSYCYTSSLCRPLLTSSLKLCCPLVIDLSRSQGILNFHLL